MAQSLLMHQLYTAMEVGGRWDALPTRTELHAPYANLPDLTAVEFLHSFDNIPAALSLRDVIEVSYISYSIYPADLLSTSQYLSD